MSYHRRWLRQVEIRWISNDVWALYYHRICSINRAVTFAGNRPFTFLRPKPFTEACGCDVYRRWVATRLVFHERSTIILSLSLFSEQNVSAPFCTSSSCPSVCWFDNFFSFIQNAMEYCTTTPKTLY